MSANIKIVSINCIRERFLGNSVVIIKIVESHQSWNLYFTFVNKNKMIRYIRIIVVWRDICFFFHICLGICRCLLTVDKLVCSSCLLLGYTRGFDRYLGILVIVEKSSLSPTFSLNSIEFGVAV